MTSTRSLQMTLLPLTSSAEDSPASPSALPDAAKEPMTPDGSGRLCETSFRTSPQLGCLEKILLDSSQWDSTECSLTWKRSATPAGRLLFRLVSSMRRTDETEFSLWRTPAVADATRGAHPCPDKQAGKHSLVTEAKGLWPTRTSSMMSEGDMVQAMFAGNNPNRPTYQTASLWPTPQAAVIYAKGIVPKVRCPSDPQVGLADVAMWATPAARDFRHPNSQESQERRNAGSARGQQLVNQVAHGAMPSGSPERTEKPGGLNPEFVCWLMGFPAGWLD